MSAKHETRQRWKKRKITPFFPLACFALRARAEEPARTPPTTPAQATYIGLSLFCRALIAASFSILVQVYDVISFVRLTARDLSVHVYFHDLFTQGKVIIFVQDVMKYTYPTCLLTNSRRR